MNWSSAVTVKLNAVPLVAVVGAESVKCLAGPLETTIAAEVPVIEGVVVSVPVIVWLPAVTSVPENVPAPLVNVAFTGNVADPSELVK